MSPHDEYLIPFDTATLPDGTVIATSEAGCPACGSIRHRTAGRNSEKCDECGTSWAVEVAKIASEGDLEDRIPALLDELRSRGGQMHFDEATQFLTGIGVDEDDAWDVITRGAQRPYQLWDLDQVGLSLGNPMDEDNDQEPNLHRFLGRRKLAEPPPPNGMSVDEWDDWLQDNPPKEARGTGGGNYELLVAEEEPDQRMQIDPSKITERSEDIPWWGEFVEQNRDIWDKDFGDDDGLPSEEAAGSQLGVGQPIVDGNSMPYRRADSWGVGEDPTTQARQLSAGTMATLTGIDNYEEIERVRDEFVQWLEAGNADQFQTWQQAWNSWGPANGYRKQSMLRQSADESFRAQLYGKSVTIERGPDGDWTYRGDDEFGYGRFLATGSWPIQQVKKYVETAGGQVLAAYGPSGERVPDPEPAPYDDPQSFEAAVNEVVRSWREENRAQWDDFEDLVKEVADEMGVDYWKLTDMVYPRIEQEHTSDRAGEAEYRREMQDDIDMFRGAARRLAFQKGDRVKVVTYGPMFLSNGPAPGTEGTYDAPVGDPANKLHYVDWDDGTRSSVTKKDIEKTGAKLAQAETVRLVPKGSPSPGASWESPEGSVIEVVEQTPEGWKGLPVSNPNVTEPIFYPSYAWEEAVDDSDWRMEQDRYAAFEDETEEEREERLNREHPWRNIPEDPEATYRRQVDEPKPYIPPAGWLNTAGSRRTFASIHWRCDECGQINEAEGYGPVTCSRCGNTETLAPRPEDPDYDTQEHRDEARDYDDLHWNEGGLIATAARLERGVRQSINAELRDIGFDGNGRWPRLSTALTEMTSILERNGLQLEQVSAYSYQGSEHKGSGNWAVSTSEGEIENSRLAASWENLAPEGQDPILEIVAYLS